MKKTPRYHKMRWIAGIIYAFFALYQLMTLNYPLSTTSISGLPVLWLLEFLTAAPAVAAALWLLTGEEAIALRGRRLAMVSTAFYILFELLFYQAQASAIDYTLKDWSPEWAGNLFLQYVVVIIRIALLMVALFLIMNAKEEPVAEMDEEEAQSWADSDDEALLLDLPPDAESEMTLADLLPAEILAEEMPPAEPPEEELPKEEPAEITPAEEMPKEQPAETVPKEESPETVPPDAKPAEKPEEKKTTEAPKKPRRRKKK